MKIVLFLLRGCSAQWLGTYGNEWVGTPHCDHLAHEGIVWDRYFADIVDPLEQRQRLIPWLYALQAAHIPTLVVRAHAQEQDFPASYYDAWAEVFDARPVPDHSPLRPVLDAWPQLLQRFHHQSHGLICVEIGRLLPPWDVPQEVFSAYLDLEETASENQTNHPSSDGSLASTDAPNEDTGAPQSAPNCEPILPCTDPPLGPFDHKDDIAWQWLHTSYAAVVTTLDAELGQACEILRQHQWDQQAVWILTSDLGFPLGEHGWIGWDRPWLYQEVVHLPLIMRLPQGALSGRRLRAWTQPLDLWTTIAQWLGYPLTLQSPGRSLLPLLQDNAPDQLRDEVISYWQSNGLAEAAVRTDDWTFLLPLRTPEGEDRPPQLYARPEDRWEVNDLRPRLLEQADACENRLRQWLTHENRLH
jgi:hypothetical protein